ncbi:GPI inositol-deacylase [Nocardia sp. NBC_00565]|uniref:lipase family alpha/beta hydrolase n=1 Tax=Nocardia sp. NBC_00565 TaxID=2975993 RepID=UPI002E808C0D|nr:alpha/beta hydrolase [Nocardia sp. NBC_00565]WUC06214.1 GPI inositol-deacylase [Nocardia sp. NBC_00565]
MNEPVRQRQAEIQALARLAGDELGGAIDGIAAIHRAVSDRVFAAVRLGVGPAAQPVKVVHDTIADGVYRLVGGTAVAAGALAERAVDLPGIPVPSRTVYGSGFLAALQGLIGDSLEDEWPILAGPMTFRVNGEPVAPGWVGDAVSNPRSRIVVFLHGLVETEHAWRLGGTPSYAERLEDDLDCTTLMVRYNSGLHISENARLLNGMLQRLVENWPIEVEQIALVGHSMGGLIARGACYDADRADLPWVRRVRHIVCLGSPHLGAPLEQLVHYASAALMRMPETRPFGRLLRRRSAGIRDLRHGSLVDEDWSDMDADTLRRRAIREVPLLDCADHYFVTATVTRSPRHPLGRIIGDGLVLPASGSGRNRARRIGFDDANGLHIPGANHLTLLNHGAVHEALAHWLADDTQQESVRCG